MEDRYVISHQSRNIQGVRGVTDVPVAFIGIFDGKRHCAHNLCFKIFHIYRNYYYIGHGGAEAANFAQNVLMNNILQSELVFSNNELDVMRSIVDGFQATNNVMKIEWRNNLTYSHILIWNNVEIL